MTGIDLQEFMNSNRNMKHRKFPTKKEESFIKRTLPKFHRFGFSNVHPFISFTKGISLPIAMNIHDLFFWDMILLERLRKLSEAHVYSIVYFSRGIPDKFDDLNNIEVENLKMFLYHSEVYYYFFFSVVDNIYQILNVYFKKIGVEKQYDLNKLVKVYLDSKHPDIHAILIEFENSIKDNDTKEIRNSLTHRFPANFPDYRFKIDEQDDYILHAGSGSFMPPAKIILNIIFSSELLFGFIGKLNNKLTKGFSTNKKREPTGSL